MQYSVLFLPLVLLVLSACNIEVSTPWSSRVYADAGPDQSVPVNAVVTLGRVNKPLKHYSYKWSAPEFVELSSVSEANPTFVVPEGLANNTRLEFSLVVSTTEGTSKPDKVVITVINTSPTAIISTSKKILLGDILKLDGSQSSDVNSDSLNFYWAVLSEPFGETATIEDERGATTLLSMKVPGIYTVQLTVDDGYEQNSTIFDIEALDYGKFQMVAISGGQFTMGDESGKNFSLERPQLNISVAPFLLNSFETTFELYDRYLVSRGIDPNAIPSLENVQLAINGEAYDEWGRGARPVSNVSWHDIQDFLAWLNSELGFSEEDLYRYRLPSESEWEYAARAGSTSTFSNGDCIDETYANYNGGTSYEYVNSLGENIFCAATSVSNQETLPVGSFKPNEFGLYDMFGNVEEWVQDCMYRYAFKDTTDSKAMNECDSNDGAYIVRGGGVFGNAERMRPASRWFQNGDVRVSTYGFRIARSL